MEDLPGALALVGEFPHDFESSASYSQQSYAEHGSYIHHNNTIQYCSSFGQSDSVWVQLESLLGKMLAIFILFFIMA